MKVYCFYLIKDEINPREFHGVCKEYIRQYDGYEAALYAFTPSKESEAFFLQTRKKNLFFEKVIQMDREEYDDFCEENKECLIEYHTFNTKKIVDGKYRTESIMMLCTLAESDCIIFYKEEYVMNIISDILDDNYFELIDRVHLKPKLQRLLNDMFLYENLVCMVTPLEDLNYDTILVDDLALYIRLFSNTFKTRKVKK